MAKFFALALAVSLLFSSRTLWAEDVDSKFLNKNSVGNTRHNLTQRQLASGGPSGLFMDFVRNDYGEVCVYCHTPHGANTTTTAPLWNRTMRKDATYTTYSSLTIEGAVGDPGANSLTCLSCHDGKVAIDSIINMPGSGKYLKSQEDTQSNAFLNTWGASRDGITPAAHHTLDATGCLACHNPTTTMGATDFTAFALGTDLSNDHPVGVLYRGLAAGTDYNGGTTTSSNGKLLFFDRNGNSRADKNEVRFYDTGDGFEVECASCHDPHGVPSGVAGSTFNATFLRIANSGSGLCLTCHSK